MTMQQTDGSPPIKRRKIGNSADDAVDTEPVNKGLAKPISPPSVRRKSPAIQTLSKPSWNFDDVPKQTAAPLLLANQTEQSLNADENGSEETQYMASPIQLTKIRDLAPEQNVDAVSLKDILGDPLIKECWNFNFLFDLDFVMQQFDHDVRDLVKVKIVHGFWMRDDERRIHLLELAERYPNLDLISSYLPDRFGTHHSKMMILFRHDDCAQAVIHTANMISKDWANMTQAVWRSPLLPLRTPPSSPSLSHSQPETTNHPIGSGERFKVDLFQYLAKYESRLRDLTRQLMDYDFSAIRAAFIGSTPSRQKPSAADPAQHTSFGWLGLQEILSKIPVSKPTMSPPHIVIQVSSIATLGPTTTWLSHFQTILARSFRPKHTPSISVSPPKFNIIFPTAEEIRTSLDGYESGGSIHMKLQSAQQQKQLQYSRPLFCHWRHSSQPTPTSSRRQAHRGPAAPHIKTYIRFTNDHDESIDWAMVTSANLSKQAWGEIANKDGEVRIQSYEVGVVVWPALFADIDEKGAREEEVSMVPVFGRDVPARSDVCGVGDVVEKAETDDEETEDEDEPVNEEETDDETEDEAPLSLPLLSSLPPQPKPSSGNATKPSVRHSNTTQRKKVVGFRMPYDLPLSPYAPGEEPWCASMPCAVPDWMGRGWSG